MLSDTAGTRLVSCLRSVALRIAIPASLCGHAGVLQTHTGRLERPTGTSRCVIIVLSVCLRSCCCRLADMSLSRSLLSCRLVVVLVLSS